MAPRDVAKNKIYRAKNRDKHLAYMREYCKKYRAKNKEHIKSWYDKWDPDGSKRKAYRDANRDKRVVYQREWYKRNKEDKNGKVKAYKERRKEWYTEWHRANRLRLRLEKAGRPKPEFCEECGGVGPIYLDHDHKTGLFRGWLCRLCNSTLGYGRDNPSILRKLADYLERHNAATADDRARNEVQLQGVSDS